MTTRFLINPGPVETSRQADSHRVGASNHHHNSGSGEIPMVGTTTTEHTVGQAPGVAREVPHVGTVVVSGLHCRAECDCGWQGSGIYPLTVDGEQQAVTEWDTAHIARLNGGGSR